VLRYELDSERGPGLRCCRALLWSVIFEAVMVLCSLLARHSYRWVIGWACRLLCNAESAYRESCLLFLTIISGTPWS
jgi:hypothetical protein